MSQQWNMSRYNQFDNRNFSIKITSKVLFWHCNIFTSLQLNMYIIEVVLTFLHQFSISCMLTLLTVYYLATGIYPCEDTHRTHSFDAYYRCVCRGGYQGKYCTEDVNECLSDPCVPPFVCYNDLDSYRCACPSDNPHCELVLWMGVVIALIVIIILVLGAIGLYRYRKQRG